MALITAVLIVALLLPSPLSAQAPVDGSGNRKQATATRVPNGSIRVDGRLDDEAWQKAAPITDFIQKEPTEGAAPTDAMDVRIVYDDDVLYVGARMFSKDGRIQAPLGRRDNIDQAEHILVSFDTFLDRRTAVVYGVTAAGVRIDRYHSSTRKIRSTPASTRSGAQKRAYRAISGPPSCGFLFAVAIQPRDGSAVGPQSLSLPADARRGRLLDPDSAHRARLVVALR